VTREQGENGLKMARNCKKRERISRGETRDFQERNKRKERKRKGNLREKGRISRGGKEQAKQKGTKKAEFLGSAFTWKGRESFKKSLAFL
jgi:hypothetical protein